MIHCMFLLKFVPEVCSVLGSGSVPVPALQWWLSSALDSRGSERLLGFSSVMSVSSITTTRASSFSSFPHSPCGSCSSLGSIPSTELALSMVRSARLPSWCTSLKTREELYMQRHTHAVSHSHISIYILMRTFNDFFMLSIGPFFWSYFTSF